MNTTATLLLMDLNGIIVDALPSEEGEELDVSALRDVVRQQFFVIAEQLLDAEDETEFEIVIDLFNWKSARVELNSTDPQAITEALYAWSIDLPQEQVDTKRALALMAEVRQLLQIGFECSAELRGNLVRTMMRWCTLLAANKLYADMYIPAVREWYVAIWSLLSEGSSGLVPELRHLGLTVFIYILAHSHHLEHIGDVPYVFYFTIEQIQYEKIFVEYVFGINSHPDLTFMQRRLLSLTVNMRLPAKDLANWTNGVMIYAAKNVPLFDFPTSTTTQQQQPQLEATSEGDTSLDDLGKENQMWWLEEATDEILENFQYSPVRTKV